MVSAIVLAAGESLRMGEKNKLLLRMADKTIIENTLSQILNSEFNEVIIVLGHEAQKIQPIVNKYPIKTIINKNYRKGMTSSIQRGVISLNDNTDGFMICLGDMPYLLSEDYSKLIRAFHKHNATKKIILPIYNNQLGNPRLFSIDFKNEILENENPTGSKHIVKKNRKYHVIVEMNNPNILKDIDSPEDYQEI